MIDTEVPGEPAPPPFLDQHDLEQPEAAAPETVADLLKPGNGVGLALGHRRRRLAALAPGPDRDPVLRLQRAGEGGVLGGAEGNRASLSRGVMRPAASNSSTGSTATQPAENARRRCAAGQAALGPGAPVSA